MATYDRRAHLHPEGQRKLRPGLCHGHPETDRRIITVGRTEYYYDPAAPKPNSLVPASNLLITNEAGEVLLIKRSDTGQWAIPGGKQEFGESAADCAVREAWEESGVRAEVTGFLGVYSNPNHIVAYTDGETRQQYEAVYLGHAIAGEPTRNEEADDVRWIRPDALDDYDIHPSMREQLEHYLSRAYPHLA
jgi:8-oxo-dGTP pyrophosphatase MutT (NUDIX family)